MSDNRGTLDHTTMYSRKGKLLRDRLMVFLTAVLVWMTHKTNQHFYYPHLPCSEAFLHFHRNIDSTTQQGEGYFGLGGAQDFSNVRR